jgi:uncharacterized protein YjdB/Leucine-rich repeat (LRR) protein
MRRCKKHIAIALSIAIMLPSVSAPVSTKAAELDEDQQIETTVVGTDSGEEAETAEIASVVSEETEDLASEDETTTETTTEEPQVYVTEAPSTVEATTEETTVSSKEDLEALKAGKVKLDATSFPSDKFRSYILEKLNASEGDVLTENMAAGITEISLAGQNDIKDLTGIGYFTNLTYLDCSQTGISTLDISNLTNLTYLDCSYNSLSALNIQYNTNLVELYCDNNGTGFNTLNLDANTKLQVLSCSNNPIASLSLTENKDITYLACSNTSITSIDVSGCESLKLLDCSKTTIPRLDLTNNSNLEVLVCYGTSLSSLDVSGHNKLTDLVVGYTPINSNSSYLSYSSSQEDTSGAMNDPASGSVLSVYVSALLASAQSSTTNLSGSLTSLNVSNCPALSVLYCDKNSLAELDLTGDTALEEIHCNSNKLTKLDVSMCENLEVLQCQGNSLTGLNLENNTGLTRLFAGNNVLASLDVSNNTALQILLCNDNKLGELDIKANGDRLIELNCNNNALQVLDLSKEAALRYLKCNNNQLTSLDIRNTNMGKTDGEDKIDYSVSCTGNTFEIALNDVYEYMLDELPGSPSGYSSATGIGITKFTSGAYYYNDATRFVPSLGVSTAAYTYVIGTDNSGKEAKNITASFTLKFDKVNIDVMLDGGETIKVGSSTRQMFVGEDYSVTCTAVNANDHTQEMPKVTWSSANDKVATIDKDTGKLTGVGAGTTDIYVEMNGQQRGYFTVEVLQSVTGITITNSDTGKKLTKDSTVDLEYGTYAENTKLNVTTTVAPDNATDKGITWSATPSGVLKITNITDENNVIYGATIQSQKAGTATVTATANDGSGVVASFDVNVKQLVNSIKLGSTEVEVNEGKTTTLKATVQPTTAENQNVIWTSADEKIATVSDKGVVTGVAAGTTTITCTSAENSDVQAVATVKVWPGPTGVTLDKKSATLYLGSTTENTVTLTPTIEPEDAYSKVVEWTSSDTSIATVSNGVVTAKKVGTVTITASSKVDTNISASCEIEVKQYVTNITIGSSTDIKLLIPGAKCTLTATPGPSTAFNKEVTWSSSDKTVATVNATTGLVTAKSIGSATITCKAKDGSGTVGTCVVTVVQPVTEITLATPKDATSVFIGKTLTVTPTVLPEDAGNKDVTWSSSDKSIATVSTTGVVKGIAKGTATITCTAADGSGVVKTIDIEVKQPVTGITLGNTTGMKALLLGKTQTLTTTVAPDTANLKTVTWSSGDENVATVSSKGVVTAVGLGTTDIICTAKDGSGVTAKCTVTVVQPVTAITLKSTATSIFIKKTATITATVAPEDAYNSSVTWSSSDTSIATVSAKGVVKGVAKGTATITCKAADGSGVVKTIKITVKQPVTNIALASSTVDMLKGKTKTLTATVTPSTANNQTVTWTSSKTSVATVDASTGLVTAKGVGTATITCKAADGSGISTTCTVNVTQPVTGITLAGKTSVFIGKTITVTPTVAPTSAANKNVTWTSSNTKVATVTAAGVVKGIAKGTATITCKAADGSGVKATLKVTVKQPVTSITLGNTTSKNKLALLKGKTKTLTATVAPTTANNLNVTWKSSNTKVATVDASTGLVTAKGVGTANITCKAADGSGVSVVCAVTVTQPVTGITLAGSTSVFLNKTVTITPTIAPTSAANKNVTWTSSKTSVATVSAKGVVTAKAVGTTTITCKAADGSGVKQTIKITVKKPVSKIVIGNTSAVTAIFPNKTATLTATVTPTDATNKAVTWTSSDKTVATVSSAGVVTAKKVGTATITCKAKDGSGITKTCTVKVVQPVTGITLKSTTTTSVFTGKTITIKATVSPAKPYNSKVTWSSSDTKIATVTTAGVVKGIAKGTATITCTAADGSGVKKTIKITVKQPVTKLTLNKTTATLSKGATLALTATATPSTANDKTVTWTSSNTAVATVSTAGKVTAKKAGTATITCTANDGSGKKVTCKITVK